MFWISYEGGDVLWTRKEEGGREARGSTVGTDEGDVFSCHFEVVYCRNYRQEREVDLDRRKYRETHIWDPNLIYSHILLDFLGIRSENYVLVLTAL